MKFIRIFLILLLSFNIATGQGEVVIGKQIQSDIKPNAGFVRAYDADGNYVDLTHYQYGATLRTNKTILEVFVGDEPTSPGHFSVRKNLGYNGATRYGCIIHARDVADIFSVSLSAKDAHLGVAAMGVTQESNTGTEYPNLNLKIENFQNNGTIEIKVSGNSVGKFTKHGFIYPKYSTAQRDALTGVEIGVTIFNTTTGHNETWNGTSWNR